MKNLLGFLKSNETALFTKTSGGVRYTLIKVDSGHSGVVYIYGQHDYHRVGLLNPFENLDLIGIYSKKDQTLVEVDYKLGSLDKKDLNFGDINYIKYDDVVSELHLDVHKEIENIIKYDETKLNFSEKETFIKNIKNTVKKNARLLYLTDGNVDKSEYATMYEFESTRGNYEVIRYIANKELVISEFANTYIEKNSESIARSILLTKETQKELDRIKESEEFTETKKMLDSVYIRGMSTVNITTLRNGIESSFKILNKFTSQFNYISSYNIVNKEDRNSYEKMFKDTSIRYDDIVKITHGRKTLYKREVKN